MRILLDENLPDDLRSLLHTPEVFTIAYLRWKGIDNGLLLRRAAQEGFDVLLTMDRGMQYEQNQGVLPCSVVILRAPSNDLEHLRPLMGALLTALASLPPKSLIVVR